MLIDQEKCVGCGICIPFCPVEAISLVNKKATVDQDACLECGNCLRNEIVGCPGKAFYEMPNIYETPRGLRRYMSDPTTVHVFTKIEGRGTEEVKTNDVTGRVRRGEAGIAVEMGRPCLGTTMVEVEKMTTALASMGIVFEEINPLVHLMSDPKKGLIDPKYHNEKLVSIIVEFKVDLDQVARVLEEIRAVARSLDTVFSLDVICCYEEDGSLAVLPILDKIGMKPRSNSKVNLGLGRPFVSPDKNKEA